jgi:hypothetical protein
MTTLYNERMNFGWLNCQNVVFPMCDIHGGSYNYDHVFMGWETCRIAYYHSEWVCTIPGPPDESGGGNPPPTPPPGPGGYTGPGGPITIPLPEVESPDNCQKVSKFSKDSGFIQRLNLLRTAAQQYTNEHIYKMYPGTTSGNTYFFEHQAGPPNTSHIEFTYGTSILAIIHSHNANTYSIFSPQDLATFYDMIKNGVTSEVLLGVVNPNGTVYIVQITNLSSFLDFGDKYLNGYQSFKEFETEVYSKKYNIKEGNSQAINELNFLKFVQAKNLGVNVYKSVYPFSEFQKLTIVNSQTFPETCN